MLLSVQLCTYIGSVYIYFGSKFAVTTIKHGKELQFITKMCLHIVFTNYKYFMFLGCPVLCRDAKEWLRSVRQQGRTLSMCSV